MSRSSGAAQAVPLSQHTFRQLKFILPGGLLTYWLGSVNEFMLLTQGGKGWARTAAVSSLGLGLTTISLFLYILLVPWIQGVEPNYRTWRESGVLSLVIPILTASIVTGWSLLALTLGQWSSLGYLEGILGAGGIYALVFGLMGLIPAPKVRRG